MTGFKSRELLDISYVRRLKTSVHVADENALAAFSDGRGVFDVDPHCRKLDAFIEKHKLEAEISCEEFLPCADPDGGNRPVYFGRARWRRRSPIGSGNVA